jgi:ABC-type branched-subunit amino acid transport system substrate-binding protein/outer membrane protein assembly factor BamD (BamD/ComL family)
MRYTLLVLVLCLLGTPLLAQRKNDAQQLYLQAKSQFQQEQWAQAMESFRRVAADPSASGFAPYASFFYAVSAIRAGRMDEAKAMLRQLQQKYPNWDKQEEVNYWQARVLLEENNFEPAIATIEKIRSRSVKGDAEEMAAFHLQRGASVDQLKRILSQHQEARYVAQVLARKLSSQPVVAQDQQLLSQLVKRYKLDQDLLGATATGTSERKESYNVAVMMPFLLENLQPEKNMRDIYFTLDIYEGMKMAQEELEAEGIRTNLYAYDTRRDSLTTLKHLRAPEMQSMDLIVGPLYPGPTKAALDFAYNRGVNLVNPISTNPEIIQNNPYAFLFKPSLHTQGRKAADFAARTFQPPRALVIYGTKDRDTIMANAYRQELVKRGFIDIRMEQIKPGNESRVRSLLISDQPEDMLPGGRLSGERIGHVMIASEDEGIVANAMNAISSRKDRLSVIGHETWVKKNLISNDQLERLGVYLMAPEYLDYNNPTFFEFRDKYLARVHSMPGRYAYLGYDLMMYFGRMMYRYGNLFQNEGSSEIYNGVICTGFNYQAYRDNQCVPIIQYRNAAAVIVYQ